MKSLLDNIEDLLLEYSKTPAKLAEELKRLNIQHPVDMDPFGDEKLGDLLGEFFNGHFDTDTHIGKVTELCGYVEKNFSEGDFEGSDHLSSIKPDYWLNKVTPDIVSGWFASKHKFLSENLDLVGDTIENNPRNPEVTMLEFHRMLAEGTPLDMSMIVKVLPNKEDLHGCPFQEVWSAIGVDTPVNFGKSDIEKFYERLDERLNLMSGPPLNRFLEVIPPRRRMKAIIALANNTDQDLFPLATAEAGNFSLKDIENDTEEINSEAWSRNMKTYKDSFKLQDLSEPVYEKLRSDIYYSKNKDERLEILKQHIDMLEPAAREELEAYIESLENFDKSEVMPKETFEKLLAKPGDMAIEWLESVSKYLPIEELDTYEQLIRKLQETKGISQLKNFSITEEEMNQIRSARVTSKEPEEKRKFKEIPEGIDPSTPSDSRGFAEGGIVPFGTIGATKGDAPSGFQVLEREFRNGVSEGRYPITPKPSRMQNKKVEKYIQTPPEMRKEFRYNIYKEQGPEGYKKFLELLAKEGAL